LYGCREGNKTDLTYQPIAKVEIDLPADGSPATIRGTYEIKKTGVHYLTFSSCNPTTGDVLIDGHNVWMNPYGYLPGEQYYNLPFFLAMIVLYILAVAVWGGLLVFYREETVRVHFHIGIVLVLALLEVILWYVYLQNFNTDGHRSTALAILSAMASTLKKTVSRLLILAVCMGYGIVRPVLPARCQRYAFGFAYCICSFVLDIMKAHESQNRSDLYSVLVLVSVTVAVLDFVFYLWTFMSLYDTVELLEEKQQRMKLNLYRKFIWVLVACLLLSCAWVFYQVYYSAQYEALFPVLWQTTWLFNAYWYVLSFVIAVAIMILWAPHANSRQYAYYDQSATVESSVEMDEMDEDPARFSICEEDQEEEGLESFVEKNAATDKLKDQTDDAADAL